ncbi:MAG: hypothetical protein L6W00_27815 [Lentisphaeria bacterium]|nr:MAG: hypothetical protein L6W00_27815 [Lentisphaeria bacterium]
MFHCATYHSPKLYYTTKSSKYNHIKIQHRDLPTRFRKLRTITEIQDGGVLFENIKNIIFIIYWIEDEVKYVILTGSHTIVNWEIAMEKRRKSLFLIYLEFVPFYLLYLFVRRLSLKQSYWISRVLFLLLMRVDKRHRVRTIQHLLHAGAADSLSEAHKLAKQVFCQFSKLLIEIFKMDQHYKPEKNPYGRKCRIHALSV